MLKVAVAAVLFLTATLLAAQTLERLELVNGDRLTGEILLLDGDFYSIRTTFGTLRLPVSAVSGIATLTAATPEPVALEAPPPGWIRLRLKNGDQLSGRPRLMQSQAIILEGPFELVRIPISELAATAAQISERVEVSRRSGDRMDAVFFGLEPTGVRLRTATEEVLTLPWAELHSIVFSRMPAKN